MKSKWRRLLWWSLGTPVVLLLLGIAGLWSARFYVWNGYVRDFYGVPLNDGPHVFRTNGQFRIVEYHFIPPPRARWSRVLYAARHQQMAGSYRAQEEIIEPANTNALAQIARRHPSLDFDFLSQPGPEASSYSAPVVAAVSDIHGDIRHLEVLLKAAGIVDGRLNWIWGNGRLVVAGDAADKGPGTVAAFWLLRKLESQASAAGGGVHALLGNHEVMLLRESAPGGERVYHGRKYQVLERELSKQYGELFRKGSVLGDWLRTRNTVVQINDVLFVHGGFSRALLDQHWSLEQINAAARAIFAQPPGPADAPAGRNVELLTGYWGPFEYKGYFDTQGYMEQFDPSVITETLAQYQCRRLVVGHSTVSTIQAVRGGKVLAIAVKLPETDILGSPVAGEVLLIKGDEFTRVRADGSREPL